jgi:hypothetical protein
MMPQSRAAQYGCQPKESACQLSQMLQMISKLYEVL